MRFNSNNLLKTIIMKKYIITYLSKGKVKHLNIHAANIASSYVIAALAGISWEVMLNSKLN